MTARGTDTVASSPLATSSPLVHGRAAAEAAAGSMTADAPAGSRRAGVLVHVTSLPGPDGIGDLGAPARGFVEWLAQAGQRAWQLLPLHLPGDQPSSPWAPASGFAGDPLLVSLDDLVSIGLLPDTLPQIRASVSGGSDPLERAARWKLPLVRQAARQLLSLPPGHELTRDYLAFCEREAWWLADHVAFTALREQYPGVPRAEWPVEDRVRRLGAHRARSLDIGATHEHPEAVVQFLFDAQLRRLHAHAVRHDVALVADVPAWVGDDSADVWAHPELFLLDDAHRAALRTGAPPTEEDPAGEVWSMPGYAWDAHAASGFEWWTRRLRHARATAELVRLERARSFADWWGVQPRAAYGEQGSWEPGPGVALLDAAARAVDPAELLLDDHGVETEALRTLRANVPASASPARVLVDGFEEGGASVHLPTAWSGSETGYAGDARSGTVVAWTARAIHRVELDDTDQRLAFALRFTGASHAAELPRASIEALMRSPARLAMVTLADWLGVDDVRDAGGRPHWVLPAGALDGALASELAATAARTGRTLDA